MSVTLALVEKNMIPNAHKLPRILSAQLVTVFTSFYIIFFIKYLSICKNTMSYKLEVGLLFYTICINFQIIKHFLNMN